MTLWKSLSSSFLSTLRQPRLWLLQFFGNAVIVLLFGFWLHIDDAHWWQVVFSFLLGLLLV